MNFDNKQFLKDRHTAYMTAILQDDWEGVKGYCRKYGVSPLPLKDEEVILKAAVYKAAQECTDIPDEVKAIAREKCIAIGFKPTMWG